MEPKAILMPHLGLLPSGSIFNFNSFSRKGLLLNLSDAEIMAKQLISMVVPHYKFAWNNLKTVNGQCSYRNQTIYLSRHLTGLRTRESVRLTIQHEIAHALNPGDGHGSKWKATMRSWGLPADRCSQDSIDRSVIANWRAVCPGCKTVKYMIRKPRLVRSCGTCSKGKYNDMYKLSFVRM